MVLRDQKFQGEVVAIVTRHAFPKDLTIDAMYSHLRTNVHRDRRVLR